MIDEPLATAGIRAKLDRAREHLEELDTYIDTFLDSDPYTMTISHEPDRVVGHLVYKTPIPIGWSVVLGEIIHNMRSALDNTVYLLSCVWKQKLVGKGTMFPIFDDPNKWIQNKGASTIRKLPDKARAYVEGLQPFNRKTPISMSLLSLNMLWSQDKHRIIQPWAYTIDGFVDDLTASPPAARKVFNTEVLHDGAEVFSVYPPAGTLASDVRVDGNLTFAIAFDDPASSPGINEFLSDLVERPAAVVETLLTMIERPV